MTTDATPNPKVLDLGALLAGVELPTDTVDVYMNAAISYAITKNRKEMQSATKERKAELEKEYESLVKAGLATRLTVNLKAVPREVRKALIEQSFEKFPREYNFMGGVIPESARDDYHANLRWAAHITGLVGPNGEEGAAPTPEQIADFRAKAPDAAIDAIEEAIVNLETGAKSGFETLAQEHGFLSQP